LFVLLTDKDSTASTERAKLHEIGLSPKPMWSYEARSASKHTSMTPTKLGISFEGCVSTQFTNSPITLARSAGLAAIVVLVACASNEGASENNTKIIEAAPLGPLTVNNTAIDSEGRRWKFLRKITPIQSHAPPNGDLVREPISKPTPTDPAELAEALRPVRLESGNVYTLESAPIDLAAESSTSTMGMLGYPQDNGTGANLQRQMWVKSGPVNGTTGQLYMHQLDTVGGDSGSCLYQYPNLPCVGIHQSGLTGVSN
jgi:hypothetical protein